ncbi:MAG: SPOR domain-containing protein [Gammaproteobacteria bacterium]
MEERIKQRLVGASVLVALAVIFIPIILEGPEEEFGPWGTKLPKPPAQELRGVIKPLKLPEHGAAEPVRRIVLDTTPSSGQEKKANDKAATKHKVNRPADSGKGKQGSSRGSGPAAADKGLQAWVVQVASFHAEENAVRLRSRLREMGYTTFVEQLSSDPGSMFRVRVGPELKRSDAQSIRDRIAAELKLDGLVTRYP